MFYFKVKTKRYCIDATEEDIMFGPARLINHSRKNPNVVPKALEIDGCPRLFFVAKRNIKRYVYEVNTSNTMQWRGASHRLR